MDFVYTVQLPMHTDDSLVDLRKHIADYNATKRIYIENGARRGKNGIINHMNIPKEHIGDHYPTTIEDHGTTDNYSTETSETFHIESCKEPYRESNRKDFMDQVIRSLTRRENIHQFQSYLRWRSQEWDSDKSDGREDDKMTFAHGLTHIKLAETPHQRGVPINSLLDDYNIPGLVCAIIRFVQFGDSGLAMHARGSYGLHDLPREFRNVDIWWSFRLRVDAPNPFFDAAMSTIHCRLASARSAELFDPVLIQIKEPNASGERQWAIQGTLSCQCVYIHCAVILRHST